MTQSSLVVKFLLCLIIPAYQILHGVKLDNGQNIFRYWLVLSSIFLMEFFLDQVTLSPAISFLKFLFLLWCFAPVDNNGTYVIYEKVLQPLFRFSNNIVEDALKNKIIEEAVEMIQDFMKAIVDCLTKINQPEQ